MKFRVYTECTITTDFFGISNRLDMMSNTTHDKVQGLSHNFVTFMCKNYGGFKKLSMLNIFTFPNGKLAELSDGNKEKSVLIDLMLIF